MADKVRIELNTAAVGQLLKSPELEAMLLGLAQRIAGAAGPGMVADSTVGRRRARASVYTATLEARRAEAAHRALSRAIDAGRS